MEQQLVICKILEVKHRREVRRKYGFKRVPIAKLKAGAELKISDERILHVIDLNDEELTFQIGFRPYILNRSWQVLSTIKLDLDSGLDDMGERFLLYFETPVEQAEDGVYHRMQVLIKVMRENSKTGDWWKNIPLAHEMMHLFKDCAPLRDEEINPVVRMQAMVALADEDLLSKLDVPRLFLSFYAYWEMCNSLKKASDGKTTNTEEFEETLNDNLFKYSWTLDPAMTSELYQKLFGKDVSLRFDFLQLSEGWEKAVYDIEKETNEQLKDEPRGMGFCFGYWSAKTANARKHGLEWRSPHIMNPRVMFD